MKIYSDSIISITQEYFINKRPLIQGIFIWIITALLLGAGIWASVAKFEEVVKVTGFIRPKNNISEVSNVITGRIQEVSYKSGQTVHKGDELLKIDPTQLQKQESEINAELEEENKKLSALNFIQKSIRAQKNLIPKEYLEAQLRFDEWQINLDRLQKVAEYNSKILEDEKNLPESMTTISKVREFQNKYELSLKEYEFAKLSFEHDIASEIDNLETSIKINIAKLEQTQDSLRYTRILAPIDGIIQEITVYNKGDWIQSGQKLFNIVPFENENMKIELSVPAKQAGKLSEGMTVKMRFSSLPYQEFGGAEGKIIMIAPDVITSNFGEAIFLIQTDLDKNVLTDKKEKSFPLKVGLQVDARIIVSKKSLLLFALEKMNLWY